jgi:hypothetical protein
MQKLDNDWFVVGCMTLVGVLDYCFLILFSTIQPWVVVSNFRGYAIYISTLFFLFSSLPVSVHYFLIFKSFMLAVVLGSLEMSFILRLFFCLQLVLSITIISFSVFVFRFENCLKHFTWISYYLAALTFRIREISTIFLSLTIHWL